MIKLKKKDVNLKKEAMSTSSISAVSKPKDSPKIVASKSSINGVSVRKTIPGSVASKVQNQNAPTTARKKSFVLNEPSKSAGEDVSSVAGRSPICTKLDNRSNKDVIRPTNRQVVEQFSRPTGNRFKKQEKRNGGNSDEELIRNLQSDVSKLKAELENAHSFNRKLSQDLAAAEARITSLTTAAAAAAAAGHQPRIEDIQRPNSSKLEQPCDSRETSSESCTKKAPSAVLSSVRDTTHVQKRIPEGKYAALPPPPPPLPPCRAAATTEKASAVVELYQSLSKANKNALVQGNYNKPVVSSAHNSIVGEIQNRSTHLLAVRLDIETKGEFIDGLIRKILAAAYTDIEDVLKFVDWLDNELSLLADERAVLKHFKWPEKKADAMREAAIEYRSLKLLENEVSFYKDDFKVPYGVALKKMAGLLDRSERSSRRLIQLRNSAMVSYRDHQIPTSWMLDSGIISKVKKASVILAKIYVKRVTLELESMRNSEKESTQEALLLQGVHFAYRAHQFSGGLDSETLCAFEEIRRHFPGHLKGSPHLYAGIPSS